MKRIFTFQSTHAVLKAEKLIKKQSLAYEIVPTPRHISSDCGMAICLSAQVADEAAALVLSRGIHIDNHDYEGSNGI